MLRHHLLALSVNYLKREITFKIYSNKEQSFSILAFTMSSRSFLAILFNTEPRKKVAFEEQRFEKRKEDSKSNISFKRIARGSRVAHGLRNALENRIGTRTNT